MPSEPIQPRYSDDDQREMDRWIHQDTRIVELIARATIGPIASLGYRTRAYGLDSVPAEGPFILVPNHSSYMDPFLLMVNHQVVRFMAKSTLFEPPVLRSIMAGGGGFPVRRGQGDSFAMDLARRLLEVGQPVAVFPEGTRYRDSEELGPPKRGAARLAIQTGVPVIPVAIYGAKPRKVRGISTFPPRLPRVTNVYGSPMTFGPHDDVDAVRDEVWGEVGRLYDVARELGHLAIRPRRFEVPPRPEADVRAGSERARRAEARGRTGSVAAG